MLIQKETLYNKFEDFIHKFDLNISVDLVLHGRDMYTNGSVMIDCNQSLVNLDSTVVVTGFNCVFILPHMLA